jgi:hypothetical protein
MDLQEQINRMKSMILLENSGRYNKMTESLLDMIVEYLDDYIGDGERKITSRKRNYGNYREDWCVDGINTITVVYYYEDNTFKESSMIVSKKLVNDIQKYFSVRQSFALASIETWYEQNMLPQFEQIVGETNLSLDSIDIQSSDTQCRPEPKKPEGITDEEMIEFIVKNTLMTYDGVKKRLESDNVSFDDLYLQIVDIVNERNITGM